MNKIQSKLPGVYLLELDCFRDQRGGFARTFCQKQFAEMGLHTNFPQNNISLNSKKGTLRGMHFQTVPYQEIKLVSCVSGRAFDVLVDLRQDSPTYCQWQGFDLSAQTPQVLYVPEGIAHGFVTLEDNTSLYYHMSEFYQPTAASGVRWNDPQFQIVWPQFDSLIISEKDQQIADFQK